MPTPSRPRRAAAPQPGSGGPDEPVPLPVPAVAVLLLGDREAALTARTAPVVAPPAGDEDVVRLLAVARPFTGAGRTLAVLHAAGDPRSERGTAFLRSALGAGAVVPVPLDLPPRTLGALAAVVAEAAPSLRGVGDVVAAVHVALAGTRAAVWSARAGARTPAGLLPWSRYLTVARCLRLPGAPVWGPPTRVDRPTTGATVPRWTASPGARGVLVGSAADLRAARAALTALTPRDCMLEEVALQRPRWRPRRRHAEIVLCTVPAQDVVERVLGAAASPCPWCGTRVHALPCPACAGRSGQLPVDRVPPPRVSTPVRASAPGPARQRGPRPVEVAR